MKNILLSTAYLAQEWLVNDLSTVLNKQYSMLVLTSINENYLPFETSLEERTQRILAHSLKQYGMQKKQVTFARLVLSNKDKIKKALSNKDVLIFVGTDALKTYQKLEDNDLFEDVYNFKGVKILIGPIAHLFLKDNYLNLPSLDSMSNFQLLFNYEENVDNIHQIIELLEEKGKQVIALNERSGLIIEDNDLLPLGDVYLFTMDKLDELYRAYDEYNKVK